MTDNEIIEALEHDAISEFDHWVIDLINRQKAEIERLEKTVEDMTEGCQIAIKVSENEAIRRFSYRLRAECGSYDTGHYIFHEDEIHNLVKEMVGEG